jgi:hypothetical protein
MYVTPRHDAAPGRLCLSRIVALSPPRPPPPLTLHPQQEEARIVVASEDDPSRQLLETRISKDDGYQKQQGTHRRHAPTEQMD